MRLKAGIMALALGLASVGPGYAQIDLLFGAPHLAGTVDGSTLRYAVNALRIDPETGEATQISGDVALAVESGTEPDRRNIVATINRDGRSRGLDPFREVAGNPVLIIFLEQITQDLSRATGGSTQYLRNRLRDGLASGLTATTDDGATTLAMRPLDGDPNAEALGPFVNLQVSFTIDPETPGQFLALSAKAGPNDAPVFLEEMTYADPK